MESVTFLKFWKIDEEEEDDEEDSFFDLELLSVSTFENQKATDKNEVRAGNSMEDKKRVGFKEERLENQKKMANHKKLCFHEQRHDLQSFEVSQTDSISKRKILPIEPSSKPQSPIQLLKSAPKFPVFIFKKQKSMAKNRAEKTEPTKVNFSSKLGRENSSRKSNDDPSASSSKRISKEIMQKYLKVIKPLYEKVLRKSTDNGSSATAPAAAPVDSPVREKHENLRLVCKHLGKSKSASAAAAGLLAVTPSRRDDSLLQQHDDGIQGAILHCKRSFNASKEHSLFSRSDSAPSHERP